MRLVVCGLNHHSAPLAVREKFAFPTATLTAALQDLLHTEAANEAVLLSTCNRTEIYTATQTVTKTVSAVLQWLSHQALARELTASPCYYQYQDLDMIRHAMRVSSGLDSMVLGEPQILGQMKQAYSQACLAGTVGPQFKQLFPHIFAATKHIRSKTDIGKNPVSIAYAVVQLAKQLFSAITALRVLLIGAGDTISLMATHLYGLGVKQFIIANRSALHAHTVAASVDGTAIDMAAIPTYLDSVDMVISATSSPLPILGKGAIESALRKRKHKPMLLIDLAVPRDIEPEVNQLEDVYLYNLDNVQAIIEQNCQHRQRASQQAEAIVEMQASHCFRQLRVLKAGDLIARFREHYALVRDSELKKAIAHWHKTQDPEAALVYLSHNLTNKFLHEPTQKIRDAAYDGCLDEIFGLIGTQ